jgi:predicted DCC family thiol-disulfide oxidoreductase YuxK
LEQKPIILFDGICNLCNSSVQKVIKNDPGGKFMFASLQSEPGQELLRKYQLPRNDFNSFVLIMHDRPFTRSSAALLVARQMKGLWKLLYGFMIIPKFLRDGVYNLIANNRYKWFGKQDTCMLPTPDLRARFLN